MQRGVRLPLWLGDGHTGARLHTGFCDRYGVKAARDTYR